MLFGNQKVIEDSVARLGISKDDVVLEIGSGNGQALLEIEKKKMSASLTKLYSYLAQQLINQRGCLLLAQKTHLHSIKV